MTDRAAELEAAIAGDPDDPGPYLVYADWLQSIGDPRGELIVLQHHGREDEARALIEGHRAHFLGPLAAFPTGEGDDPDRRRRKLDLAWHLGFLHVARIGWSAGGGSQARREAVEALQALLALPSSRFLRHLAIDSVPADRTADFGPFLDALARAERPPPLRSLFVTQQGTGATRTGPIAGVLRAYPELRDLSLGTDAIAIGELRHARLRAFGIASVTPENLIDLRTAELPRLERLTLVFGSWNRCEARDLAPLLDGDNLPSLSQLGLHACTFADEIVRMLAGSRLLPRLQGLDLSGSDLTDDGVAAMQRAHLAFSHLARLDLERNQIGDAAREVARGLARYVHVGTQRPPEVHVEEPPDEA